jgi:hypothetical protein
MGLTIKDLENLIDQMLDRQMDRLLRTHCGMKDFLMRPEERAVTAEIVELRKVIDSLQTIAVTK